MIGGSYFRIVTFQDPVSRWPLCAKVGLVSARLRRAEGEDKDHICFSRELTQNPVPRSRHWEFVDHNELQYLVDVLIITRY
jgi:hypothetical protein